jgi:hypothetical protein
MQNYFPQKKILRILFILSAQNGRRSASGPTLNPFFVTPSKGEL